VKWRHRERTEGRWNPRFDDFTKALATATSRRQALKAIGVALGGVLGLGSIGTAFADKTCKQLGQGCNNKKNLCCPGLICQSGVCVAPTTTTTAAPTTTTTTTTTHAPGIPYSCPCNDGTLQTTCGPTPCTVSTLDEVCNSLCAAHGGSGDKLCVTSEVC
jgi:hypothetical protein